MRILARERNHPPVYQKHTRTSQFNQYWNQSAYAKYQSFSIGLEDDNYRLSIFGYSGTVNDSLEHHNNMMFAMQNRTTINGAMVPVHRTDTVVGTVQCMQQ